MKGNVSVLCVMKTQEITELNLLGKIQGKRVLTEKFCRDVRRS